MPALSDGSRAAVRAFVRGAVRGVSAVAVRIEPVSASMPSGCACCGATAGDSLSESFRGWSVIVPYCGACHFHASSVGTRRLGVALSSLLLALSLAAAVPLLAVGIGPVGFVVLVVGGALLPVGASWLPIRRLPEGHTARGRAVWWSRQGDLVCTNAGFARELAGRAKGLERPLRVREPLLSPSALAGVGVALAASPGIYLVGHPPVRILNLTPSRAIVEVDGRRLAPIEPTSQESPRAGTTDRLLAGARHVRVLGADGGVIDEREVHVVLGAEHLYALGADGTCFWVETTTYGRDRDRAIDRVVRPLGHGTGFWSLHRPVDTWFSPNPATGEDGRSTGGELTALRQAPCLDAPRPVRELVRRGAPETFAPAGE